MTDVESCNSNNSFYEFNVKLCAAIKKHKCLYDRIALRKSPPPPCQIAWQTVAKECGESVKACKTRWKSLQLAFFQSLKRKGNRYYLHDQMDFLLVKSKTRGRKPAQITNTNDEETNLDDDFGQQENNNADDEEPVTIADSDSHTTSADESSELNNSREQSMPGVGGFIIDEIGVEADEDGKRLSYKRACKRGLDPDLINDVDDEEPGEKKSRKSLANEEQDKQVNAQNKKFLVRMDKIKINNKTGITNDNRTEASVGTPSPKKLNVEVKTYAGQFKRSIFEEKKFQDSATQYDIESKTYDDVFLESIRSQLLLMNGRQKMIFKRKMYESLLEVFDDNTDFPKANEMLKAPPKAAPKLINTTVGELRLMRELVSLVQAAKNTPEIMESKEKVKTANESTSNPPAKPVAATAVAPANNKVAVPENRSKASISSPLSLSPSLEEDDDLQFSLDNIDDEDDVALPKSWDDIKAKTPDANKPKPAEDNVMGLPKRVLQKVVRVAGSNGSTIVARDGDKKRIYRIYPKTANNLPANAVKPGSSVGTFIVGPHKTANDATTNLNKSLPCNISIRPMPNNSTTTNNSGQISSNKSTAAATPTIIKSINPGSRLLSPTTGYFKMVSTSKNLASPANTKITTSTSSIATSNINTNTVVTRVTATKNPMLPPNLPTKRTVQIRSHVNSPQLMQRRYSICGPLPSEKSSQATSPKAFIINRPADKSSVSQIQISQPISLNTKAQTSTSSNHSSTSSNTSTVSSTTSNTKPAPATPEDVKPPKTLEKPQDNIIPLEPLVGVTERNALNAAEEIPILETAGTIGTDNLDPLFVKPPQIKAEPLD